MILMQTTMLMLRLILTVNRTMLGWDQCSPSSSQDSQGEECRDTCQEMEVEGKVVMMMMMMIIIIIIVIIMMIMMMIKMKFITLMRTMTMRMIKTN